MAKFSSGGKKKVLNFDEKITQEEALAQLNASFAYASPEEEYRDGYLHPAGYFRTGILALDAITKGNGLPRDAMIQFYGVHGFGKTTVLMTMAKALVESGVRVLYVMVEPGLQLAKDLGLLDIDPTMLYIADAYTYNDLQLVTNIFLKSEFDVIIIDSLSMVKMSLATMADKKIEDYFVGTESRLQTQYLGLYHGPITRSSGKTMIYSMHTGMDISGDKEERSGVTVKGSEASKFVADIRIAVVGTTLLYDKDLNGGENDATIGRRGWLMCDKNRHALPFVRIPITIWFGKGVVNSDFLRHYVTWSGLAQGAGAWFTLTIGDNGETVKVQGKAGLITAIRENAVWITSKFYADAPQFLAHLHETRSSKLAIS